MYPIVKTYKIAKLAFNTANTLQQGKKNRKSRLFLNMIIFYLVLTIEDRKIFYSQITTSLDDISKKLPILLYDYVSLFSTALQTKAI